VSKLSDSGRARLFAALAAAVVVTSGCEGLYWPASRPVRPQAVPEPLEVLLPKQVRIQEFTGTRDFGQAEGVKGIDVRIEAKDGYGDTTKALGTFHFELFHYKPNSPDPKGDRIAVWTVNVEDPKVNRRYWNDIHRIYQFKLGWKEPIPVGRKFVLTVAFQSKFTERLFHQRVFVSGE
jgi:hypothetical protein